MALSIYCDGGVILKNPSPHGGTWAWLRFDGGTLLPSFYDSGVITPGDIGLPAVTNNLTELLAAVLALEELYENQRAILYTDSFVTLCRLTNSSKFRGIPDSLRLRCLAVRDRAAQVVLLGGHPNKAELAAGKRADGLPCSLWNVRCDQMCGEEARNFLARQQEARP